MYGNVVEGGNDSPRNNRAENNAEINEQPPNRIEQPQNRNEQPQNRNDLPQAEVVRAQHNQTSNEEEEEKEEGEPQIATSVQGPSNIRPTNSSNNC